MSKIVSMAFFYMDNSGIKPSKKVDMSLIKETKSNELSSKECKLKPIPEKKWRVNLFIFRIVFILQTFGTRKHIYPKTIDSLLTANQSIHTHSHLL